jgi:hypothetical protein
MDDLPKLTLEELKGRRSEALSRLESAALLYPATYRELKRMLCEINSSAMDISQYYRTALQLTKLLKILIQAGAGTIFDHYLHHIDPAKDGDVRYFRFECLDLAEQLKSFEKWSAEQHNLKVIK